MKETKGYIWSNLPINVNCDDEWNMEKGPHLLEDTIWMEVHKHFKIRENGIGESNKKKRNKRDKSKV